jgi:hypothetical protein
METTVRILVVLLIALTAIGVIIFVGRYLKVKATYWFSVTSSLSISSVLFWIINQIIIPDLSDIFFLIYGLVMGVISIILLVKNNSFPIITPVLDDAAARKAVKAMIASQQG